MRTDFFEGFDENFAVPPRDSILKLDSNYNAALGRCRVDYEGDIIGEDVYPVVDGQELACCPAQMANLGTDGELLECPKAEIFLDESSG